MSAEKSGATIKPRSAWTSPIVWFFAVICGWMILGAAAMLLKDPREWLSGLILGGFFGGLIWLVYGYVARLRQWEAELATHTFENYRLKNPKLVRDGRSYCLCGGQLHSALLKQRLYHRRFFCSVCGNTAYYVPEGRQ